ncbi:MAG: PEP-CTERM sorting domain-containing protein, partial [Rubrivivax sp.]
DLDLNDGITPGLIIQGQGSLRGYVYDQAIGGTDEQVSLSISGQSFSPDAFNVGNATSAIGGNSLSATSVGTVESALGQTASQRNGNEYYQGMEFRLGRADIGYVSTGYHPNVGGNPEEPLTITLTANTGLVIEGTASTALTLSEQGFQQLVSVLDSQATGFSPEAQRFVNTQGSASASVLAALARSTDTGNMEHPYTSVDLSVFSYDDQLNTLPVECDDLGNCQPASGPDQSRSFSENFKLQYANFETQAQDLSLLLSINAGTSQNVYIDYYESLPQQPTVPTVPSIPEPGTWALMGLGVLGLSWARRRNTRG